MIRVRCGSVPVPASLVSGRGPDELAEAIIHFTTPETRDTSFKKFRAYKGDDVKAALASLFGEKCAYCEGTVRHVAPPDIEHFRPKSGVKFRRGDTLVKPGYYWLATDWGNLLPSCIDCNRGRTQRTAEDQIEDDGETRGKENVFPLDAVPTDRLDHRNWNEQLDNRSRLLIHPCRDQPETHLEFHFNGTVTGRTDKGRETILVLGLDRLGLIRARRETVLELARMIRTIAVLMQVLDDEPEVRLENELERLLLDLDDRTTDHQPFAALARTVERKFHDAIRRNEIDAFIDRLFREAARPNSPSPN